MRTKLLRLTLLAGTAATVLGAGTALAQTAPAAPNRDRPAAATEGTTQPRAVQPPSMPGNRADSVRPDTPNEAARLGGQGAGRGDAATGATTTPAPQGQGASGSNRAVNVDEGTRRGPLATGSNSFTEGQARERISDAGFTNVEGLMKDDNGIWRGRAMQNGRQVEVGLDYRGNVAPLP